MTDFAGFYQDILTSFAAYPAIIHGDRTITYRELDERTNQLARVLLGLGVKRDENVGIAEYNTPAFLEAVAAAWKITARAVTLNSKFKEWELKHVIEDAEMRTVIFNEDIADRMINLRPELPGVKNYVIIGDRRVEGMLNYEELVEKEPRSRLSPPWEGFRDDDIVVISPMMHAWAYNHALIGMIGGFTSVMLPSKSFDVLEMLQAIEKHRANVLVAVGDGQCRPFADELDRAAEEGRRYDLSSLLVIISSGMALSVDVKRRLLDHLLQLIILDVLASTEGHYISVTPYTAADRGPEKTVFRVSDMVKVITEEGVEARPGEIGEVAVAREHQGSSGYYRDAEKTARTYRRVGGKTYIFTGDMAMVDEKGRIHLIGRGSGCINTGGGKVFPEEVEEVINRHPAVELSGVTSVPHPRWGEAVTAVIQLKPGASLTDQEIVSWCKDRLADYKAPKYVLFVEELPRLITGKVHYREIKKLVSEKYEQGEIVA